MEIKVGKITWEPYSKTGYVVSDRVMVCKKMVIKVTKK
jgi:hypothetical protein